MCFSTAGANGRSLSSLTCPQLSVAATDAPRGIFGFHVPTDTHRLPLSDQALRRRRPHAPPLALRLPFDPGFFASVAWDTETSGEGAAPLWLLLLARTTCSAHQSKHLSML